MTTAVSHHKAKPLFRPRPREIRGVHVTMGLAGLPGKIDTYLRMRSQGLNTLEVDVKDESGQVAFSQPVRPARARASAPRSRTTTRTRWRARCTRSTSISSGGSSCSRIPSSRSGSPATRSRTRTDRSGTTRSGSAGRTLRHPGLELRWPSRARGRQGGLRRDPVRLRPLPHRRRRLAHPPRTGERAKRRHDRPLREVRRRPGCTAPGSGSAPTSSAWPRTATWGSGSVRRKIGRYLDTISPMAYPVALHARRVQHRGSGRSARPDRLQHAPDFHRSLTGRKAVLVPWLQDFSLGRTYTFADVKAQIDAARTWAPRDSCSGTRRGTTRPARCAPASATRTPPLRGSRRSRGLRRHPRRARFGSASGRCLGSRHWPADLSSTGTARARRTRRD